MFFRIDKLKPRPEHSQPDSKYLSEGQDPCLSAYITGKIAIDICEKTSVKGVASRECREATLRFMYVDEKCKKEIPNQHIEYVNGL